MKNVMKNTMILTLTTIALAGSVNAAKTDSASGIDVEAMPARQQTSKLSELRRALMAKFVDRDIDGIAVEDTGSLREKVLKKIHEEKVLKYGEKAYRKKLKESDVDGLDGLHGILDRDKDLRRLAIQQARDERRRQEAALKIIARLFAMKSGADTPRSVVSTPYTVPSPDTASSPARLVSSNKLSGCGCSVGAVMATADSDDE